jgi:hypothetical protein
MSYLFSLPGIMLLGYSSFPVAVIIFVAISFLVWLKQAYEDANEPEITTALIGKD